MAGKLALSVGGVALLALLLPDTAFAHGFGDRYDLPVPLGLYITGAGLAVALSFVLIGVFSRGRVEGTYPRKNLLEWKAGRALAHPVTLGVLKVSSAIVFVTFVVAGLFGNQRPDANLAPTLMWVGVWVGIAYLSALVGDIWALINPWKVLFGYAETVVRRLAGVELSRYEPYPSALGSWPAAVLFFGFAWVEIVYTGSAEPFKLGVLSLAYSAITVGGMWMFGRETWLRNGEFFTVVFSILSSIAPAEVRVKGEPEVNDYESYSEARREAREWNLRPWGAGLLAVNRPDMAQTVLLVMMLATVSFDGFVETGPWTRILINVSSTLGLYGANAFSTITTLGLLAAPALFFSVFAATAWLMRWLTNSDIAASTLVRAFVYSLVPIAFAYHIAHFFGFLFIQGQALIPLASDPLGRGWDLFGTAGYVTDIGVVNARFTWLLSIAVIVVGHVIAVYVAHVYALRLFPRTADAVRSQYPMMALMVGYTMVSLWIIAQPIVQ